VPAELDSAADFDEMKDPARMKPCLSEATTLSTSFADDLDALADGGQTGMEVWLTKLEDHLKSSSIADTRKLVEDKQVPLAAASYQGGLLLSQGEQRRTHYDHFRRRLEICQELRIPTVLLVADFVDRVEQDSLQRAVVALARAAQWAAGFDVRLALEFRARSAFCSSLDTAVWLVSKCGETNVGVNLDLFHYYTGPSKFEDLELLTAENLAFVQLADLAGVPRELATDADRVLPGDGDFRFAPILERLRKLNYAGYVSIELMNPTLWNTPASQVIELARMALTRLLPQP
jgi:sugar phosphate isomerase/epimerase